VLRIQAEHEFPIPTLSLPDDNSSLSLRASLDSDAVVLFIQRATASLPTFQVVEEDFPAIARICIRLDGLPLAIELAAARIKLFPPAGLLARLDNRMTLLTGGSRDLPARQQTMRAALAWSYDLLTPEEQQLFRTLSIFPGGFTFELAGHVVGVRDGADLLDGISSLLDKNLLTRLPATGAEPRLGMLETIREFARERLDAAGEPDDVFGRVLEWYGSSCEAFVADMFTTRQHERMTFMDAELENLRAVVAWGIPRYSEARYLAGQLSMHLMARSLFAEGEQIVEWALAESDTDPDETRVLLLVAGALNAWWRSDFERAARYLERASGLVQDTFPYSKGDVLSLSGLLALRRGDFERAEALVTKGIDLLLANRQESSAAQSMTYLAGAVYRQGDFERAERIFEDALARNLAVGNSLGVMLSNIGLARIARDLGETVARRNCSSRAPACSKAPANALNSPAAFAVSPDSPRSTIRM
jgi:non-specific serine/threonine protein kinase